MAFKWHNNVNDSGILRKNDFCENKEDLLVFGYSCKLFRDDEKALLIDQGKHLIPWMGDDTLKIDRYDCRGNLAAKELAAAESRVDPVVSWQHLLSAEEQRAERLCDEERYRALHTDEDEEEMYREEELKRLHMAHNASYGQVQFNYEGDAGKKETAIAEDKDSTKMEDEEAFVPTPELAIPDGMPLPETKKLNAIIEKTAMFIASQGTQMEILLKAKQAGNTQFDFLSLECPLHHYYSHLLAAIREGRYRPEQPTKQQEEKQEEEEYYLHPSLAPVSVESAPSIPSIAYKPSANCAYSMLVNQIKGKKDTEDESAESDIAPPGTETLPLPIPKPATESESTFSKMDAEQMRSYAAHTFPYGHVAQPDILKPAVMYDTNASSENLTNVPVPSVAVVEQEKLPFVGVNSNTNSPKPEFGKSSGLKLIHYSDSEGDSDSSDSDQSHSKSSITIPPPDLQIIVDKMASYVAKNGDAFENIVKMKGDPRFYFLNPEHQYYGYYRHKRSFYEQTNKNVAKGSENGQKNEAKEDSDPKVKAPVSFSIKKIKDPEPILPKPALPYESSSDEENPKDAENSERENPTEDNNQTQQPKPNIEPIQNVAAPKVTVETCENKQAIPAKPIIVPIVPKPVLNIVPAPKIVPPPKPVPPPVPNQTIYHIQSELQSYEKVSISEPIVVRSRKKSALNSDRYDRRRSSDCEDDALDRRKSKRKRSRSRKRSKRDRADDVIMIEEDIVDSSDFIDLTDDIDDKDKRDNLDGCDKNKIQIERKRRAAAFLSTLKGLPSTAANQQSTLASAMVKTLNTFQGSQETENRKYRHRRRDDSSRKKRNRRDSKERSYSDSGEEDYPKREKSDRSSRHRHSSRKHSKKSKKSSSKDDRYRESRSHGEDSKKHRSRTENSPKDKKSTQEQDELRNIEEYKMSRKQDKLLTSSLKELVKEARKDLISKEPIKMAVDIFSNDSSAERSPSSSVRNTPRLQEDDWEKDDSEGSRDSCSDSNESSDNSE